jgi:glycosyltransferase involved in cell wall biosynthesis
MTDLTRKSSEVAPESGRIPRVLLVAPQPFYQDRGTPIAVHHVLEALSELGYRVDLLTFPGGSDIDLPGVQIIRGPNPLRFRKVPIGFSVRKVLLDAGLALVLRRLLTTHAYDCIHAVEEAAILAAALRRGSTPPIIYDMQSHLSLQMGTLPLFGLAPVRHAMVRMESWLFGKARIVACSSGLAAQVRQARPGTPVLEWIYPGQRRGARPDEIKAIRSELGLPAGARVVTYTGTFESYQGISVLTDAMARVRERIPNTVFVLVGETSLNGRPSTRRAETPDYLRIVERQPRDRIAAYLAGSDILVSTRIRGQNVPLKIFDYLAAGRPIVATDDEAHRQILSEQTALLTAPEAAALAEGIVELLQNRERARLLAETGRRYAERHLGWAGFVSLVNSLYQQVLPADEPTVEPRFLGS